MIVRDLSRTCFVLLTLLVPLRAQHEGHGQLPPATPQAAPASAEAVVLATQKPIYPLDTCVVSGEPLDGSGGMTPVDLAHDGRLVRFCCKGCVRDFQEAPARFLAAIDAAVVAAQKPSYPLASCVISGEPLGEDAVDVVFATRLVRLARASCTESFLATPQAALAEIDAALVEVQLPSYPLATCVVTGEALGDDPARILYGTKLVQLCCEGCLPKLLAEPERFLMALRSAPGTATRGASPAREPKGAGHASGCACCRTPSSP